MGFGIFTLDSKNRKVHLESFKIGAERKEVKKRMSGRVLFRHC